MVSDVERSLRIDEDAPMSEDETVYVNDTYVSSIAAGDCTNISSVMKALIGGFTRWDPEDGTEGKNCDITLRCTTY